MLRSYRQVFRIRGLALPLLASFAGSLPIGMLNLSVLLLVRLHGQSLTTSGLVAGAVNLGAGAGLVVQGAWIDRCGQTRVLAVAGLTCATSLAVLVAGASHGGPVWLTAALALAAGGSVPATPTAVRVLCTTLVAGQQLRVAAYAMLAMASTTAAVLGPLLVSALLAGGATAAVLVTAGLAAATAAAYALASRRMMPPARPPRRQLRGLATAGMRTLIAASAATGAALGMLAVAIAALAVSRHTPALAGGLNAVCAAGDLAGGLIYGARSWPQPLRTRLAAALLALAASCAVLGAANGDIATITVTALIQHAAPHGAPTESYAIVISATLAGTAAGNLAGGALVGASLRLVFLAAGALPSPHRSDLDRVPRPHLATGAA